MPQEWPSNGKSTAMCHLNLGIKHYHAWTHSPGRSFHHRCVRTASFKITGLSNSRRIGRYAQLRRERGRSFLRLPSQLPRKVCHAAQRNDRWEKSTACQPRYRTNSSRVESKLANSSGWKEEGPRHGDHGILGPIRAPLAKRRSRRIGRAR